MFVRAVIALVVSSCAVGCGSAPAAHTPATSGAAAAPDDGSPAAPSGGDSSGSEASSGAASGGGTAASAGPRPTTTAQALEKRAFKMQFDLELMRDGAPAGMQSGSWSISEERTLAARAVSGDAITKLELIFGRRDAAPLLGLEQPSVTENKTFLVEGSGATPSVTRAGKPAPDAERDAVLYEYGWVGAASPLVVMLRGAKPGAVLHPPVEARKALLGDVPGIDEQAMDVQVVYKRTRSAGRPDAELAVTAKGPLVSGDMTFNLDLSGPATLDLATGWVTQLTLSGKVKAKGKVKHKKGKLDASGHGSMSITRAATFH